VTVTSSSDDIRIRGGSAVDFGLLPTTVVGSWPQPDWLVDRDVVLRIGPPRVRAR